MNGKAAKQSRELQEQLEQAETDLRIAKKELEVQATATGYDVQLERVTRAAAQRGLVRYIKDLQSFAASLRQRGLTEIADEMKARGLDPEIGYDPDLDPVIQADARVGRHTVA